MPHDPYAVLRALLRAEAARRHPRPKPQPRPRPQSQPQSQAQAQAQAQPQPQVSAEGRPPSRDGRRG
ncbi:hypothetical protein [Streptomyces olivaceus]|uniref:hypothetical protein n=1 Tax=Streptomyces olivaceus TaxID=47716 RepID=UPI001CC9E49B|nr:hypothetical protein [Streptomyces olivaceus]MBZ6229477.1 hypothetical protein [Streptomyces olivaceus]